jgi:hypothetical protein
MIGDDNIIHAQQWVIRRYRFNREDIDASAPDPAVPQRVGKCLLVHKTTAGHVDQKGSGLHKPQFISIDHHLSAG